MTNIIHGVVLVMWCRTTERFLLVEELESKTQIDKKAGMKSFPCETRKSLERGWKKTAVRALREETGILVQAREMKNTACLNPQKTVDVKYKSGICSKLHIVFLEYESEFEAQPEDSDVRHAGWFSFEEIENLCDRGQLRVEMSQVIRFVREHECIGSLA